MTPRMEVMKYTATPKAGDTGSGMSEPKKRSFCQGGIIYPAFEAPVIMLLLCSVLLVSHLVPCSVCLIDMFICKSAVSKKESKKKFP